MKTFKGALCCFGEGIQNFDIYDIRDIKDNRVPRTQCEARKVKQYEIVFCFKVRLFIEFIHENKKVCLFSLGIKQLVNIDLSLLIKKMSSPKLYNATI